MLTLKARQDVIILREACLDLFRCIDQQLAATGGTMGNAAADSGTILLPNVSRRP